MFHHPPGVARRNMEVEMNPNPNVFRPPDASIYTGLSESTLAKRRLRGEPPVFVRLGARSVGYRREDLDQWLADCRRRSTSQTKPCCE